MARGDDPLSGRRRLGERSDEWADREAGRFADRPGRTGAKWLAILAAVVVCVAVFFGLLGLVVGWFNTGRDIVGPANVKEQNFQVREAWLSLVTGADNACQAGGQTSSGSQTFLEDPALAYAATYRRTWVEYNRRMDNAFEARVIRRLGLGAYPRRVPDYPQAHGRRPDWCAVSERLARIGPS